MGKFIDAVKAGVGAAMEDLQPGRFAVDGRAVRCPYCGGEKFARRQLHSFDGVLLTGVACTECSTTIVFERHPERVGAAP
jgi:DNA-directed RNA polymerase subunit RPC12/RpoP